MNKLATVVVTGVAAATLASAGCKHKPDMAAYKARATALAAKYAPKLAEYSKHLPDAAKHAKDLPVNIPGAEKLAALIADNESTLKQAQDVLADLPKKLASETPEQAEKELAAAEALLANDVKHIEEDENAEAALEAELEAKAKEVIAPVGAAAPAGTAAAAGSAASSATGSAK